MAADIITRIVLDNSKYKQGLNEARGSLKGFEGEMKGTARTITNSVSTLTKLGGAFGAVAVTAAVFKRGLESVQTGGDAFVKIQNQMKASVDSFFVTLGSGNGIDTFLSGLQNVIDKAGELSTVLDALGTKTLFGSAEARDLNAKYQIELNAAKARNASDAERNKHLEKAKSILGEIINIQTGMASANTKGVYATMNLEAAKFGYKYKISDDTWDYMLKDSNRPKVDAAAAKYGQIVEDYRKRINASLGTNTATGDVMETGESRRLKAELKKYQDSAAGRYGALANAFQQMADDEQSAIANALRMRNAASQLAADVSAKQLEIANTDARINGSYNKQNGLPNGGTGGKGGSRIRVNLEWQGIPITDGERIQQEAQRYWETGKPNEIHVVPVMDEDTGEGKLAIVSQWEQDNASLEEHKKRIQENREAVMELCGSMGQLGDAIGGQAGEWISWAANLASAIASALPRIATLTAASEVDAQVQGKDAAAKAANSVAHIPGAGPVLAVAAIASVMAALLSMPKFANGGIVPGNSTSGDKVLARLNSGEVVLNAAQQSNLADKLTAPQREDGGMSQRSVITGEQIITVVNNALRRRGSRNLLGL